MDTWVGSDAGVHLATQPRINQSWHGVNREIRDPQFGQLPIQRFVRHGWVSHRLRDRAAELQPELQLRFDPGIENICHLPEPWQPEVNVRLHSANAASRLAALLTAQILPVFSRFAPGDPGAPSATVRLGATTDFHHGLPGSGECPIVASRGQHDRSSATTRAGYGRVCTATERQTVPHI